MPGSPIDTSSIEGEWNGFEIRIAKAEDCPKIWEHISQIFCRDEPLSKRLGYSENVTRGIYDFIKNGIDPERPSGLTLVAYHKETGEIAGSRTVEVKTREEHEALKKNPPPKKDYGSFQPFFNITGELFNRAFPESKSIFDKYNVDKYAYFTSLSVDRKFRQAKLAKELFHRALKLAQLSGYPLVLVYFTSNFTKIIGNGEGFELLAENKYDEYKENGELVFTNMDPHTSTVIMTKKF